MLRDKVKKKTTLGKEEGKGGHLYFESDSLNSEDRGRAWPAAGLHASIHLTTLHSSPASALKCLPGTLLRGFILHPAAEDSNAFYLLQKPEWIECTAV